ncbi:uncharacterized protein LOC129600383 [Paramacrobiotus metropolitanus]|uniref:uncharacterized protein LOC129600383 n=1 Tax=Paramacrobiotus metropolitanus TaxID=2943436 RepID=UPI0024456870|nr:uncharacterized protein LOC129600383 [Paramacrobiotus metropolitanus]
MCFIVSNLILAVLAAALYFPVNVNTKRVGTDGVVCPYGAQPCGHKDCYRPQDGEACEKGRILPPPKCGFSEERCGSKCYHRIRETCTNGTVCGMGEAACGSRCYHKIRESCTNGTVCGMGEAACGAHCYHKIRESCTNGTVCGMSEAACGTQCYHKIRENCTNGTVCGTSEAACGARCYLKIREKCYPHGIVCENGEQPCGKSGKCYRPQFGEKCKN